MKRLIIKPTILVIIVMLFFSCATDSAYQKKSSEDNNKKIFNYVGKVSGRYAAVWLSSGLIHYYAEENDSFDENMERLLDIIKPYTIICVMKAGDDFDNRSYLKNSIQKEITLIDSQGNVHSPLEEPAMDTEIRDVLGMLRLLLKMAIDEHDEKIAASFFFFQKDGQAVVDTSKEGIFCVTFFNEEFEWKVLPLSFKEIASYDPRKWVSNFDYGTYYYKLGSFYENEGNYSKALFNYKRSLSDYRKAGANEPNLSKVHFGIGNSSIGTGEYQKAVEHFSTVIENNPGHFEATYNRGRAYLYLGHYDQAIPDFERAAGLNADNAESYSYHAWILSTCPKAEYRDGAKAVELALKAVEIDPKATCLDTLAAAYAEINRFDEAVAAQEKALALLAQEGKSKQLIDRYTERLKSYKAGQPWRETTRVWEK